MKELKKAVKKGKSKDAAFERLKNRRGDLKKGSAYLARIPEKEFADKYSVANNVFLAIYGILACIGFLALIPDLVNFSALALLFILGLGLIIPVWILYLIYHKNALGYLLFAVFSFKAIFDSFRSLPDDLFAVLVGVIMNVLLLTFVVILKKKLFPYQNFFNTKKDADGLVIYK